MNCENFGNTFLPQEAQKTHQIESEEETQPWERLGFRVPFVAKSNSFGAQLHQKRQPMTIMFAPFHRRF